MQFDDPTGTLLVTGGAGFIGGNFVLGAVAAGVRVVNLDALTYAGNLDTLASLHANPGHVFVHGDIGDRRTVRSIDGRAPSACDREFRRGEPRGSVHRRSRGIHSDQRRRYAGAARGGA